MQFMNGWTGKTLAIQTVGPPKRRTAKTLDNKTIQLLGSKALDSRNVGQPKRWIAKSLSSQHVGQLKC